MKFCVLMGSLRRDGNTAALLRPFLEECEAMDVEAETIWLYDRQINPCLGCKACQDCLDGPGCVQKDDFEETFQAMVNCDGIILATPIYAFFCTPPMKALLDHYGYRWMLHRPQGAMFRKQGVCISTAAGAGIKTTNRDMADSLFFWGVPKIYRYGVAVLETSYTRVNAKIKANIDRKTTKLAQTIRRKHGRVKPGLKTKGFFAIVRMLHKIGWNEADIIYWKEKGWEEKARPWKQV